MEAIEFKTTPKKDGTIQIPKKYKSKFPARVRVVLMWEEEPASGEEEDIIDRLMKNPIKSEHFTPLSREAAHWRGHK